MRMARKHFEADGNAVDLDLGFVPTCCIVTNKGVSVDGLYKIEWDGEEAGDGVETWTYLQKNDGDDNIQSPTITTSSGYISAYDTTAVGNRQSVVFDEAGGAADDLCTVSGGHGYAEGEKVHFIESGGLPTGLSEGTAYYVKYLTLTTFQVSLTSGGDAVEMTGDGSTPNYVFSIDNLQTSAAGFKGITIAAAFMSDGDKIYVHATLADTDKDDGDING